VLRVSELNCSLYRNSLRGRWCYWQARGPSTASRHSLREGLGFAQDDKSDNCGVFPAALLSYLLPDTAPCPPA
jgi:hypothetical protein